MKIVLLGDVPSKKNSRITVRSTGRSFPSKNYQQWEREHLKSVATIPQLASRKKQASIEVCIFPSTRRAADLTNKVESINDLLVKAGVFEDDNWFVLPGVFLRFKGVDKENPRVEIEIKMIQPLNETTILTACAQSDRTLGELLEIFDCRYSELQDLVKGMVRSGVLQKFIDHENECFVYRATEEGCKVLESTGAIELSKGALVIN